MISRCQYEIQEYLQALIELAGKDNQHDERALLESIVNRFTARGARPLMHMRLEEE